MNQSKEIPTDTDNHQTRDLPSDVVRTNEVIGVEVKNLQNESLGKIHEIVLDKNSGQVRYVVLSFGGLWGLGANLYALPWNAISYDPQDKSFILNVEKETLKNGPNFDKDNWPNLADKQWGKKLYNHYGYDHNWE